MTNLSREYEIIGENFDIIAITVLRSIGILGQKELHRRPGRPSGIALPCPDSQMEGLLSLDFALSFDKNQSETAQAEKDFHTIVETYNHMPFHAMKLNKSRQTTPYRYSMFTSKSNDLILSTVEKAENANEVLARFYNPSGRDIKLDLDGFNHYVLNSLKENIVNRNFYEVVKSNQVITVRIKINETCSSNRLI